VALLASWVLLPLHTQRRSPDESVESDPTDTELHHGQSASADTKVSVYKICHENEKRSEGVDWIHLIQDSPVVDSLGIRQ